MFQIILEQSYTKLIIQINTRGNFETVSFIDTHYYQINLKLNF